jgi:hypothetical protein
MLVFGKKILYSSAVNQQIYNRSQFSKADSFYLSQFFKI